ncbi:putative flavoprotein [Aspergillus oryzae 100-8]|uniref:L-ornithine N(5)-monooxygenase n=1 Tax=Aspergillus oryzae (strain 3.042) TaxID=1160506 RepID=I8A3M8_ASPO3|nr:putative flavoprotein involved in K+ transport [Aspergillus oryzae 3.042]KDE77652.1 putative flavoprotein [Aspergillus oryzae 100-8]|eukprot:EIT79059.1 putative flavoprotein involved in K+ transport [Aspergillus oryzae 3.042]
MAGSLRIRVENAYDGAPRTFYPVVVIGAGASGIAAGCRLKQKCGCDQFRVFDRQSGIGGTWWRNRYPGVVSIMQDRPAFFYSFSFAPNYLSKTIFPSGRDYIDYLYNVVERAGIADKIQLNTEVISLEWIEKDAEWEQYISQVYGQDSRGKKTEAVEIVRAKVVISAVGVLAESSEWPSSVASRDTYNGQLLHSARWPDKISLDGQDVVLVGSGCSAAQIAPALLQTKVKSLTQIMRTAPWLVPRVEEPGGRDAYAKWAPRIYGMIPGLRYTEEASCLAHMRALAPITYHDQLTPTYQLGCKRRIYDNDWLRGMHDPRFMLESRPWRSVADTSITVGDGDNAKTYHADTLILATGFEATQFLQPISVVGRHGLSLHGLWATRGGPHAYLGTAVDGFPNFLILGPNTFSGHTSVIMAIENSVDHAMRLIAPILDGQVESIEPKTIAVQTWLTGIRRDMASTVFASCQSWYNGGGRYNSVMYPGYIDITHTIHNRRHLLSAESVPFAKETLCLPPIQYSDKVIQDTFDLDSRLREVDILWNKCDMRWASTYWVGFQIANMRPRKKLHGK